MSQKKGAAQAALFFVHVLVSGYATVNVTLR
jgi:hypothetical protein